MYAVTLMAAIPVLVSSLMMQGLYNYCGPIPDNEVARLELIGKLWLCNQGSEQDCLESMCHKGSNVTIKALIDGMQHNISDSQLTASSIYTPTYLHSPKNCRLHAPRNAQSVGAWQAKYDNQDQWIQADFQVAFTFVSVATQGRDDNLRTQWTTSYRVLFCRELQCVSFTEYEENGQVKVFTGNSDRNTVVQHDFAHQFSAYRVRLNPTGWSSHVSLRWELYGWKCGA